MATDIGIQLTKTQFDAQIGQSTKDVLNALARASLIKAYLAQFTAAQLETLYGYQAGDGTIIQSAFTDLDQLNQIFLGNQTLATAKDFRTFAKQLYSTGL